jgi:hypothetical protein
MFGREYRTSLDLTFNASVDTVPDDLIDYIAQLKECMQAAYAVINKRLQTKAERMKTQYDAKVRTFQLSPGDFVFYYGPRRQLDRYQKWRRLCSIFKVENRFNDVLYSVRTSPRAKPILAHIDRLRMYDGDLPDVWKAASTPKKEDDSSDHPLEITTPQDANNESAVRIAVRPNSDCVVDTQPTAVSSTVSGLLSGETFQSELTCNENIATVEPQVTITTQPASAVTNCQPTSAGHTRTERVAQPQRARRPPARYRCIYRSSVLSTSLSGNTSARIVDHSRTMDNTDENRSRVIVGTEKGVRGTVRTVIGRR